MAIIKITSKDNNFFTFELGRIKRDEPRVYQAKEATSGEIRAESIYNEYSDLFNPIHFSQIEVNGQVFDNVKDCVTALNNVIYNDSTNREEKAPSVDNGVIDWQYSVGEITAKKDLHFTFKNLCIGTYFLIVEGDVSVVFPEGFDYVGGERSPVKTIYQITCLDTDSPKGIYSILKKED